MSKKTKAEFLGQFLFTEPNLCRPEMKAASQGVSTSQSTLDPEISVLHLVHPCGWD